MSHQLYTVLPPVIVLLLLISPRLCAETRVVVHSLEETALTSELQLSGTLRALREAELSMAADALVTKLHVDVGSHVKQGDLLVELDSSLAAQEQARAQANEKAAETRLNETRRLLNEALQMKEKNYISLTEVDARESAVNLAVANLEQARAETKMVAEQLEKHQLRAPFDGAISARWTELGEWLSRGDPVLTLVSLDELRLDLKLPQEHLSGMEHLRQVEILPDAMPETTIPARVDALVPVGDQSRSFLLRLAADGDAQNLLPGTSARAQFIFEHPHNAVLLPRDAVLRNADGNFSVFVVVDGQAQRRRIQLGQPGSDGYLIREGLQAGEQVVVRGNELLRDGQTVTIVDQLGQNHDD